MIIVRLECSDCLVRFSAREKTLPIEIAVQDYHVCPVPGKQHRFVLDVQYQSDTPCCGEPGHACCGGHR